MLGSFDGVKGNAGRAEGHTSKRWSWGIAIAATVLAGLLVWLAGLRFPITLVMPPSPAPDYAVQTAWSLAGAVSVVLIAVTTILIGSRMSHHPNRIFVTGLVAMAAVGLGCGAVALIASAP